MADVIDAYKCESCEEFAQQEDIESPLYECPECGQLFTREMSANGNHQCPNDNKFSSKLSELGCPSCGEGEMHPVKAWYIEDEDRYVEYEEGLDIEEVLAKEQQEEDERLARKKIEMGEHLKGNPVFGSELKQGDKIIFTWPIGKREVTEIVEIDPPMKLGKRWVRMMSFRYGANEERGLPGILGSGAVYTDEEVEVVA